MKFSMCHPDRPISGKRSLGLCSTCYQYHRKRLLNKEAVVRYRSKNRERISKEARSYFVRRKYGLSMEELGLMKDAQEWKCAICGNVGRLCLDHDHSTGKARALLCIVCNFAVGRVEKRGVDYFAAIVAYVRRHE